MSDLYRLRELAALFRPPTPLAVQEARVKSRADLEKKFKDLEEGVDAAMKDLLFEVGEGGALETMMDDVGVSEHKDAASIIEGMQSAATKFKKDIGGFLMEAEGMLFSAMTEGRDPEPVNEMAAAGKYRGGAFQRKDAKAMIAAFKDSEETFDLSNGDKYRVNGKANGGSLAKGDIVFAVHDKHNTGAELYQIMGFGNDKGVVYDTVKAAFAGTDTKTLKALETWNDNNPAKEVRLVVKDLEDGDEGDFFYLYMGRWAYGSGAEPLSFFKVEKV